MKWKTFLGIGVTLGFGYLAVRNLDLARFGEALGDTHLGWWLIALLPYAASHVFRGLRWQAVLSPLVRANPFRLISFVFIGLALNGVIPARFGDFFRSWLVAKDRKLSLASSLAVVGIERLFDGVAIVTLLTVVLWIADLDSPWLIHLRGAALTASGGLVTGVALMVAFPDFMRGLIVRLVRLLPNKLGEKTEKALQDIYSGLLVVRHPAALLGAVVFTFGQWLTEALFYWAVYVALDLNVGYPAALLTISLISLAVILPAAPGYVGVFEFAAVTALGVFGALENRAFAAVVVAHITQLCVVIPAGFFFLFRLKVGFPWGKKGLSELVSEKEA